MNAVTLPANIPERTIEFAVEGMTCASCVMRIERALRKVPGVIEAVVNLATERASVRVSGDVADDALHAAVTDAGYVAKVDAAVPAQEASAATPTLSRETRHLILAALLSLPLVLPMFGMSFGKHWMLPGWWQFALAAPVQFILGARFYKAAWKAIRARTG